jgi:hypothetical protein
LIEPFNKTLSLPSAVACLTKLIPEITLALPRKQLRTAVIDVHESAQLWP